MSSISLPRRVLMGGGTVKQVGSLLSNMGLSRPLVVTDSFLMEGGQVQMVSDSLIEANMHHDVFSDTIPEPSTASIDNLVQTIKRGPTSGSSRGYDSIIALGGGSPMDSAKAAGVLAAHGGRMADYKAPFVMDKPSTPVIAIPTTAGTGSEATRFTIIIDSDTQEKMLCIGMSFLPTAAVLDYELTLSKPWRLTADTGIDALCHAMEAFVSRKHNIFSDTTALQSLSRIGAALQDCCHEPDNHDARESMMMASFEAGMAFNNSSVTLIHGMSRPIGALYHVPHGLSNAMLAPAITAFSIEGAVDRYAHVSRALGMCPAGVSDEDACTGLVNGLYALNEDLEVPKLANWTGVDQTAFSASVRSMSTAALASGSPSNNPRVPTVEEMEVLYQDIFVASN